MSCSTVLSSSKGYCRSAEVCPNLRRHPTCTSSDVYFICSRPKQTEKKRSLVDESLDRHVGIKVATRVWRCAKFRTNAGLLCSVGSGSDVALTLRRREDRRRLLRDLSTARTLGPPGLIVLAGCTASNLSQNLRVIVYILQDLFQRHILR